MSTLLYEDIKNIKLSQNDLMSCLLTFTDNYKTQLLDFESKKLTHFFESSNFLLQSMKSIEEGIVLGTQLFILSKKIDFKLLIKNFIDYDGQKFNINEITEIDADKHFLETFFNDLRKEYFSLVVSKNKNLSNLTISLDLLEDRKLIFIESI